MHCILHTVQFVFDTPSLWPAPWKMSVLVNAGAKLSAWETMQKKISVRGFMLANFHEPVLFEYFLDFTRVLASSMSAETVNAYKKLDWAEIKNLRALGSAIEQLGAIAPETTFLFRKLTFGWEDLKTLCYFNYNGPNPRAVVFWLGLVLPKDSTLWKELHDWVKLSRGMQNPVPKILRRLYDENYTIMAGVAFAVAAAMLHNPLRPAHVHPYGDVVLTDQTKYARSWTAMQRTTNTLPWMVEPLKTITKVIMDADHSKTQVLVALKAKLELPDVQFNDFFFIDMNYMRSNMDRSWRESSLWKYLYYISYGAPSLDAVNIIWGVLKEHNALNSPKTLRGVEKGTQSIRNASIFWRRMQRHPAEGDADVTFNEKERVKLSLRETLMLLACAFGSTPPLLG